MRLLQHTCDCEVRLMKPKPGASNVLSRLSLLGGRAVVRAQVCHTHVRSVWARISLDLPFGMRARRSCAPGVNELEAGP